jgi:mycofactocin precursor
MADLQVIDTDLENAADVEEEALVEEELLVEDVSIDGMCGVY